MKTSIFLLLISIFAARAAEVVPNTSSARNNKGKTISIYLNGTDMTIASIFSPPQHFTVRYLEAGEIYNYEPLRRHRGFFERDLRTYCYKGEDRTLRRLFETVELILEIEGDDYTQYDGSSPEEVQQHYDEHRSLFSFNLFSQKRSRLPLSPFVSSCMGIETIEPYRIRLHKVRVDFWRVLQLIIGCLVFQYAGKLSHNSLFYYITGVTLGICSSFMLLIWLSSKLVPR